jgi:hypothetical protein
VQVQSSLASSSSGWKKYTLLEKEVGHKCLAALLGVGHKRLHKLESTRPDLRYGQKPYMSKPGTWTVDAFLKISYDAVAETLPDELLDNRFFLHMGRERQIIYIYFCRYRCQFVDGTLFWGIKLLMCHHHMGSKY